MPIMTVEELIALLQQVPADSQVLLRELTSGDLLEIHQTVMEQAHPLRAQRPCFVIEFDVTDV